MSIFRQLIGLVLIGCGVWFTAQGVRMYLGSDKNWWRPPRKGQRYPYPIAGMLMGIFFVLTGLFFTLHGDWQHASILGYIGGGFFILVFVIGIAQPRFCHPRWYGNLEDRLGKERVEQLKLAARRMEEEEWSEVAASEAFFEAWVAQTAPHPLQRQSRGYTKRGGR